jgi:cytochrome c oxidase assembly protein subunit 15
MAIAELPIASIGEIRAPAIATATAPAVRVYFAVLSLLSLGTFVFGVENRFISDGLIRAPPSVDWIPPLSAQEWFEAFAVHQRDPAFAACGGTESLALFKVLYWWEWLRRASLVALPASAAIGFYCALLWQRFRFVLPRLGGLALLVFAYWIARNVVELSTRKIEAIARFNVGQYRHAIDMTFASVAAAAVLASAVVPPVPAPSAILHRIDRTEWLWITVILVDICFGGLFTGRNAAAFWWTWPGYEGQVLPPLEQLTSYSPWWLNFTFNPYTIQLVHRSLSEALWIAALWQLVSSMLRAHHLKQAIVRFVLISVQMFAGVATLFLIAPAALSTVHQVGPIFMLAASLVFLKSSQQTAGPAPIQAQPARQVLHKSRCMNA